jgi:hypothetical protein
MSTWEQVEIIGHTKIYRIPTPEASLLEFSGKDISKYVFDNSDLYVKLGALQYQELLLQCRNNTPCIIKVKRISMIKIPLIIQELKETNLEDRFSTFIYMDYKDFDDVNFEFIGQIINMQMELYNNLRLDIESEYKLRKWKCLYGVGKQKRIYMKYDAVKDYELGGRKYNEAEEKIQELSKS